MNSETRAEADDKVLSFPPPWKVAMPHEHLWNSPDCWCEPEIVGVDRETVTIKHRSHH